MPQRETFAEQTDAQPRAVDDDASSRLYEEVSPESAPKPAVKLQELPGIGDENARQTFDRLLEPCMEIIRKQNSAISLRSSDNQASITQCKEAIRLSDELPTDWLKRTAFALNKSDFNRDYIQEMLKLPVSLRLNATLLCGEVDRFREGKEFFEEAKRIDPSFAQSDKIQGIEATLRIGARSTLDKSVTASAREQSLLSFFQSNLPKLDRNNDGFLSDGELDKTLAEPVLSASDSKGLRMLRSLSGKISDLNNDELGVENDGITVKDMEVLDKMHGDIIRLLRRERMLQVAAEAIAEHDASGRGLHKDDLVALSGSKDLDEQTKRGLQLVVDEFDAMSVWSRVSPYELRGARGDVWSKLNLLQDVDRNLSQ